MQLLKGDRLTDLRQKAVFTVVRMGKAKGSTVVADSAGDIHRLEDCQSFEVGDRVECAEFSRPGEILLIDGDMARVKFDRIKDDPTSGGEGYRRLWDLHKPPADIQEVAA